MRPVDPGLAVEGLDVNHPQIKVVVGGQLVNGVAHLALAAVERPDLVLDVVLDAERSVRHRADRAKYKHDQSKEHGQG